MVDESLFLSPVLVISLSVLLGAGGGGNELPQGSLTQEMSQNRHLCG